MSNEPDPKPYAIAGTSTVRDWLDEPLLRYRCYYTDAAITDDGPLNAFLLVKARSADQAARITEVVTACARGLQVVQADDKENPDEDHR